jgi:hypothetical protein
MRAFQIKANPKPSEKDGTSYAMDPVTEMDQ